MPDEATPWVVKGVPERTKRRVKSFAADQEMTMGQALEYLIDTVLADEEYALHRIKGTRMFSKSTGYYFDEIGVMGAAAAAAELEQRQREGRIDDDEEIDEEIEELAKYLAKWRKEKMLRSQS